MEKFSFYWIFELPEAFTTRIHQKNVQNPLKKNPKNTAAGTKILPQKGKVRLFFPSPPPCGNLPYIHRWWLWPCMTMYIYLWPCMTIYDYIWLCMTMFDYVWQRMTMYDYEWDIWLYMTMYDYVWPCMTMYDKVWLYMGMYQYVWLCMIMNDYVWL